MVRHCEDQFLFHARGIEHHSNGVQNALGTINLVLATGRIGKPKSGYGTITGQANGQGGREHGQKCDQLPGWRDISNPEHRRHIAGIWGIDEKDMPGPGVDAYELFRKIDAGEIKGLLSICFNPKVSLPDNTFVTRGLEKLEFYVAIDFFLNDTARHADMVLPGSLQEEDEGTVTQVEGRVIKINKAIDPPGDAQQDWRVIQDIARALGRPHGFTFASPREIFDELRRASKGGVADYSGMTYEKIEAQMGVFWPCYSEDPQSGQPVDHPGTPRLFERGGYNPVAKGKGPFYFPDGEARFNVAEYRPAVDDVSDEYPLFLTTGRVVSHFLSGTQTRRIGPLVNQVRRVQDGIAVRRFYRTTGRQDADVRREPALAVVKYQWIRRVRRDLLSGHVGQGDDTFSMPRVRDDTTSSNVCFCPHACVSVLLSTTVGVGMAEPVHVTTPSRTPFDPRDSAGAVSCVFRGEPQPTASPVKVVAIIRQ